jgi:dihydroorotase
MGFQTPGAIDLHVHLREPGTNTAENIESGTRAALMGGFVLVADMPNNPGAPVHSLSALIAKHVIAEQKAWIPTAFYAGAQPETYQPGSLTEMAPHAIGLKLYGDPTTGNDNTYEAADFQEIVKEWHAAAPSKPIMFHAGRENLHAMLGLVAQDTNHPMHICHVNDAHQIRLANEFKAKGAQVTTGVTPHHILKTSHDRMTQGVFAEMMPPLVDQTEAEQLMDLLARGEIDVIETDFAPHSVEAKYEAEHSGGKCFGVPGIEHVLPLMFYQMRQGRISEQRLLDAVYAKPAAILGTRIDGATEVWWNDDDGAYRIGESDVQAQCGWSPYMGMLAIGRVESVTIGGRAVVSHGRPLKRHPEIVEQREHQIFWRQNNE